MVKSDTETPRQGICFIHDKGRISKPVSRRVLVDPLTKADPEAPVRGNYAARAARLKVTSLFATIFVPIFYVV